MKLKLHNTDRACVEGAIGRLESISSDLGLMKGDYLHPDDETGDRMERAQDRIDEALRHLRPLLKD